MRIHSIFGNGFRAAWIGAFTCMCVIPMAPVGAQEVAITPETIAHRIDRAGRQRMLVERMAAMFCYARSQVDTLETLEGLREALELFHTTHTGLKRGDPDDKLYAEQDPSVLRAWSQVNLLWVPLKGLYEQILSGEFVTEEDYALANGLTLEVRQRANDMVSQIRAKYAEDLGGDGFGDALLLDLYGRERMFSQKLAKEVCLAAGGYELDSTLPELEATLKLFERSMVAFVEGLPVAGVPKPPTEAIATQLGIAKAEWEEVGYVAQTIVTGGSVGLSDLAKFRAGADRFLVEMNKAVVMLAALQAE